MLRALEVAKDVWDELGQDLARAPAKIGEHVRVCQVIEDKSMNVSIPKIGLTSRRSGQRRDVRANVAMRIPRDIFVTSRCSSLTSRRCREVFFNVAILNPRSQRSREVFFFNVATFPRPINHDFYKNFLSVENSLHSARLLLKACTKLSMLFILCRSNLGTFEHCNTNTSKLKQAKSNLANLK